MFDTNRQKRILVVDDDTQVLRVLRTCLKSQSYDVRIAENGASALDTLGGWPADLIITDLAMPGMDGLELCKRLRATLHTPIIVLSANGAEQIKVESLDSGADNYLTKPFGIDELLARVRAALRRAGTSKDSGAAPTTLEAGDFSFELKSRTVSVRHREVYLTPKQYDLLVYFMRHAGKLLTHRALLAAIWGDNFVEQVEYLRVFVRQLRGKIERNPLSPRYILTQPWRGYRFDPAGLNSYANSQSLNEPALSAN
jgi:two-component system KDP operon response regulator KdpE